MLAPGPNPWKVSKLRVPMMLTTTWRRVFWVVVILEELGVPYEVKAFKFDDVRKKRSIDINPNGRVHGTYILPVRDHDVNKILTYGGLKEKHHLNQWLQFQISGQGPYYGVASCLRFNVLHHEKPPSAIERYNDQSKQVLGVLDSWLEDRQWLVGDKMTYADLAFLPWNDRIDAVIL
ncbi:hypothetical protein DL768_002961 [Monosporascus sp. mg162]|nr:hypothetical protein DL768_002961 [Monosporascus sp. mg162]